MTRKAEGGQRHDNCQGYSGHYEPQALINHVEIRGSQCPSLETVKVLNYVVYLSCSSERCYRNVLAEQPAPLFTAQILTTILPAQAIKMHETLLKLYSSMDNA